MPLGQVHALYTEVVHACAQRKYKVCIPSLMVLIGVHSVGTLNVCHAWLRNVFFHQVLASVKVDHMHSHERVDHVMIENQRPSLKDL